MVDIAGSSRSCAKRWCCKGCRVGDLDEMHCRAAGHACGRTGTSDGIDMTVVVGSGARGDLVVTSDTDDITRVASVLGV